MTTKSSSASSSNPQQHQTFSFDLDSYLDDSNDQILSMYKIDGEVMPAVLKYMSDLRSSIVKPTKKDEVNEFVQCQLKYLDWIENDLMDVRNTIGKLKDTERLLNLQMKELLLVCVKLDGFSKQMKVIVNQHRNLTGGRYDLRNHREKSDTLFQFLKEFCKLSTVPKLREALNLILGFNLRSFVESEDQMLGIHKLHEFMPAVLNHVDKLKNNVPETHKTQLTKPFDWFKDALLDVRNAMERLKDTESLLCVEMKKLVSLDLNGVSKEMENSVQERRTTAFRNFMGSLFSEFSLWPDYPESNEHYSRRTTESGELSEHSPRTTESGELSEPPSEPSILLCQILKEISQLDKAVPKLKEFSNWIPKVSLSAYDVQQHPLSNPSHSNEETNHVTSFDESILSTMSDSSVVLPQEIKTPYESLEEVKFKLCLLCFSAFPNNSIINKRILTYWWIGEGFLESLDARGAKTPENVTDDLFEELSAKGFIEPVHQKRFPAAHKYQIQPFMRTMVDLLAHKAGFFDIDSTGKLVEGQTKSRKACLVRTEEGTSQNILLEDYSGLKDVETLFNVNVSYLDLQSHWFSKLQNVHVLHLGRWQSSAKHRIQVRNIDFLKSLSNMKFLRYLSLRGISGIPELPVNLSNLTEMRVFDLRACHNLQKLPDGIGKLKNLTHLDMSECYLIDHMPKELALLLQLQVLKGFVIDNTENSCTLTELSRLKKLRKLSVYVRGEAIDTEDQLVKNLKLFTALRSLTITWVGVTQKQPAGIALKSDATRDDTFKNLEKLDLRGFPWSRMSGPLDPKALKSLKKLYIRGGELCDLQHIGQPWNVEILRLKYLFKLGMRWDKLQASFPQLSCLQKVSCPNLRLFPCDENGVWMKSL